MRSLPLALVFVSFVPCLGTAQSPETPQRAAAASDGVFVVSPYLQLGDSAGKGALQLLWHTDDADADWQVKLLSAPGGTWTLAENPTYRRVAVEGVAPHRVYRAQLSGVPTTGVFHYRVSKAGQTVFAAEAHTPKGPNQPTRFVVMGDIGAGTTEQRKVAYQVWKARPDMAVVTGDIVYERGRISEYRKNFWPVYNAPQASPEVGAPLLSSTVFVGAPGNHDVATRDLDKFPDGLAYFLYWDQPLNGPTLTEGSALVPKLVANDRHRSDFEKAAGPNYPRMASFSFDSGNAHWTILDSNPYVDWTNPELRSWVAQDLAAAKDATWRFVAFHHPGFHSSRSHYEQQHMRTMADLFEEGKVDVVFNGHVHNYQRSRPMKFVAGSPADDKPLTDKNGKVYAGKGLVPGHWDLDTTYDGRTNTRPNGVIYVVTGAGGQHLYDPEQQDDEGSWQGFTVKHISKVFSWTLAELDGKTLTIRQVGDEGAELDRFVLTK